jgi:hypothetical protein
MNTDDGPVIEGDEGRIVDQPAAEQELVESPQIDPYLLQRFLSQMRDEQNIVMGVLGGAVGAAIGAVLWTAVTTLTNYQIGYMAIAVGFLAGFGVRFFGKGIDKIFQYAGAALSLVGCLAGNLLVIIVFVSKESGMPFMEVASRLNLEVIIKLMRAAFNPIDLFFYFLAISIGYKISLRKVPEDQLKKLMK